MVRISTTIGILVLALAAFHSTADAAPYKIGAIGDSISTGMDADDDCDTLFSCASRLGEDRGWSWTTGYSLSDSMRKKLGFSYTVEKQKNGARWDDGLGQANAILSAGGATTVTIELGGNDVMRNLYDTLPTKAEIKNHIHNTLNTLVNAPSTTRPSTIVIAEVPSVVNLRDVMRSQKNFVFETCQDLWDLNTSKIEVNTCDWGFFDFLCDIADFIIETVADFVSPLTNAMLSAFNVKFPGGYVLSSKSTSTKRSLARALNNDINAAIAEEVAHHQGVNGVSIKFASNVSEYGFTAGEVSQLDCFHPNRRGQRNVARTIFSGAKLTSSTSSPTYDTGKPYMLSSPASTVNWEGSGTYRDIRLDFYTNENATIHVDTYDCSSGYWYHEGVTDETPTQHEFHMKGFYYYHYWQTWVLPQDVAGNYASTWYASGCI